MSQTPPESPFFKVIRPQIELSDAASRSLDRVRAAQGKALTRPKRNVSEMLSQLYVMVGDMLDELAANDLPLEKRIALAEKAARLLPTLDKAERRSRMVASSKAPEEMTDDELAAALKNVQANKKRRAEPPKGPDAS